MELYEVMRTTSAVRHFTNDPLPDEILYTILDNARFAPSGGNRQGTRIVIIRDPDTRQALVELTIPATKKYVAQRQAGESPWNTIYPSRVSTMRLRLPRFPKALQLRSCRRESFLWCALTSGLSLRSTRSSIGLASSHGHRFIRWYGTSCSRRATKVSVERSRPWLWRKSRGSATYSGSLRPTPLPAWFRWANPFTNHAGSHGSTLQA